MIHEAHQCEKHVFDGTMRGHRCTRRWKVERDGKRYCTQHDPQVVAARRDVEMRRREQVYNVRKRLEQEQADKLRRNEALAALAPKLAEALQDMIDLRDASIRQRLHPKGELEIVQAANALLAEHEALAR